MTDWDLLRQMCPKLYKEGIYFECGPGWYNILRELSIKIEEKIKEHAEKYQDVEGEENEYCEMYAVQVKEKYGTLSFYMSCATEGISNLIDEYEAISAKTCENCGGPAKIRGKSWIEVKCDKCYEEKK
jgi:hypothetical protein